MNAQTNTQPTSSRKRSSLMVWAAAVGFALLLIALPALLLRVEPTGAQEPAVTDPGRIAFASDRDGDWNIYTMNPDGADVRRYQRSGDQSRPAISPDGNKIAYSGWNDAVGSDGIHVMNVNGTGQDLRVLEGETHWGPQVGDPPDLQYWYGPPEWSPDGTRLALTGMVLDHYDQNGYPVYTTDIYTVRTDGTGLTNVTNTADRNEEAPSWSRDGKIAFSTPDGDIHAVNADGSGGYVNLTNTPSEWEYPPAYSPDGSKIAYFMEGIGIYTMPASGGDPALVRLVENPVDFRVSWSPDGSRLVYSEHVQDPQSELWNYNVFTTTVSGEGEPINLTGGFTYAFDPSMPSLEEFAKWGPSPTSSTPTVTSTIPKANATEVAHTINVKATFSEDMQRASVKNAFKLFKKGSDTKIAAEVSYNDATDTATLDPNNNLRRGVTYKAVVTTVAKDLAGNRLDQDPSLDGLQQMKWFFTIKR